MKTIIEINGNDATETHSYRGYSIVREYAIDGDYDGASVEIDGENCDFNTVDRAKRWIDDLLDVEADGWSARDEWGLRFGDVI